MAHKTVRRLTVEGGSFTTPRDALIAVRTAIGEDTHNATLVKNNANVQRTVTLLEDGSGVEIVDIWTSEEAKNEHANSTVKPAFTTAGVATVGAGLNGVRSTLVSAEDI